MSIDVEVAAQLSAQIGELAGAVGDLKKRLERDQAMRPHPASAVATLQSIGGAPTTIAQLTNLGSQGVGPAGGMVWEIRRISFDLPPVNNGANGGTLIVYRNGVAVARTTTIPNFLTFSGYELILQPNEDLQAVWYAPTVGGTLVVDVSAVEYPTLSKPTLEA